MPKPRPFDANARDLANHLFATATAVLESAAEVAVAGQHPRLTPSACAARARELRTAAADLTRLADAALVIAGAGDVARGPRTSAPKRRS